METIKCNLCGAGDYRFVYSMPDIHYFKDEWFNVVECKNCGLGFINPRPHPHEISKYYPPAFYQYFNKDRDYHERRYRVEAEFPCNIIKDNRNKLLLDIGCANGDFPRYMKKRGWHVEGVEISSNSKPISDFKVYTQEFTKILVTKPRYDVITAWAVLEHVDDPMAYYKKASEVLKPGGIFVFLVTNFKSISSRYLFREDVPRHLYYFTEETVEKYLTCSGFKLIKIDYSAKIYSMRPVNWLRYYVYKVTGRRLEWKDIPNNREQYFAKHGLSYNLFSNLRYIFSNPFTVIDRLLMPIFEKYQILSNKYGIATYVAIKPYHG